MERCALNLEKRRFFSENYATIPPRRGFGFNNRSLGDFARGKRSPKAFFDCGSQGCRIISEVTSIQGKLK
jgi:hypothetical protein